MTEFFVFINKMKEVLLYYPFWPGLGALLLNVRVCLCLNFGGPFLGVVGPVAPPGARALPAGGLAFILAVGN